MSYTEEHLRKIETSTDPDDFGDLLAVICDSIGGFSFEEVRVLFMRAGVKTPEQKQAEEVCKKYKNIVGAMGGFVTPPPEVQKAIRTLQHLEKETVRIRAANNIHS